MAISCNVTPITGERSSPKEDTITIANHAEILRFLFFSYALTMSHSLYTEPFVHVQLHMFLMIFNAQLMYVAVLDSHYS
jgi:hypothetical protein